MFTPNSNEFLDFEMQRTNSSFQDFPVWTQIIWTFDIKLADISANESSFFCVCVFCFVEFDLGETKWPFFFLSQFEIKTICRLMSNCGRWGPCFFFQIRFDIEEERASLLFDNPVLQETFLTSASLSQSQ